MGSEPAWRQRFERRAARNRRQDRTLGDSRFSGARAAPAAVLLVAVLVWILLEILAG